MENSHKTPSVFSIHGLTISQQHSAAKIGTDALLLGHWFKPHQSSKSLLDIGTGTGILSLLALRRFSQLSVKAIDPDKGSALDVSTNFSSNGFSNQSLFLPQRLEDFMLESTEYFDEIVCNPPYHKESVISADHNRHHWRHISALPIEFLIKSVGKLLTNRGSFHLIIPFSLWREVANEATANELFIVRSCGISPYKNSIPNRIMITLAKNYFPALHEHVWMYEKEHLPSTWYLELLSMEFQHIT
jgi:tRNA1Val (adenine37-N6)-methyltransferase